MLLPPTPLPLPQLLLGVVAAQRNTQTFAVTHAHLDTLGNFSTHADSLQLFNSTIHKITLKGSFIFSDLITTRYHKSVFEIKCTKRPDVETEF